MIEAIDTEIGRLLVETGLADADSDGALELRPATRPTRWSSSSATTARLGNTVKEPFDRSRAKGTAYQTGVWVPLVVAGPLVKQPDREVTTW